MAAAFSAGRMGRIPALTAIRGIAALLVFVAHYTTMAGRVHFGPRPGESAAWQLLAQGVAAFELWTGVEAPVHVMRDALGFPA